MTGVMGKIGKALFYRIVSAAIPLIKLLVKRMFRLEVSGIEHLDFSQKAILVPNHVSLLDPILLALFLPEQVTFAVNTGISKRFSWLMTFRNTVAVDPLSPYSVRKMLREVGAGRPLCIFPEGRVNVESGGTMMKVYSGIGYLALSTQARLYPIAIGGLEYSKLSYLKNKVRQRWFPGVSVRIGKPFDVVDRSGDPMRLKKERATEQIRCRMIDHLVRSRLKPDVISLTS
ncbi:1-acyl-sn-glycerol-3-phosphate acyltransferase [Gordoniibacillus kamchatkensis]|uniref:1-acyl-sn-glycerol-3-phosphate acyltransferase n=1 Tax=Gordoniibacillus kamchatkensis TaxID=1590651 RepID=UPI000696EE3A|nr:1-acyl-sn-glycerol-3-phosphate acyltransferase [Paenibacillus sp. VKM B-2647]